MDIDANAHDDEQYVSAFRLRLDKNPACFPISNKEIIGPAQVDVQLRRHEDGVRRREPSGKRNDRQVLGKHARPQHHTGIETFSGG